MPAIIQYCKQDKLVRYLIYWPCMLLDNWIQQGFIAVFIYSWDMLPRKGITVRQALKTRLHANSSGLYQSEKLCQTYRGQRLQLVPSLWPRAGQEYCCSDGAMAFQWKTGKLEVKWLMAFPNLAYFGVYGWHKSPSMHCAYFSFWHTCPDKKSLPDLPNWERVDLLPSLSIVQFPHA